MILAYNLSTAVLEWHAATTQVDRISRGICVHWKPPHAEAEDATMEEGSAEETEDQTSMDVQGSPKPVELPKASLLGVDYGSDDDDDDDEQEKDQQSVEDALEPASLIEDALNVNRRDQDQDNGPDIFQPKAEDVDVSLASQINTNAMDVDKQESLRGSSTTGTDELMTRPERTLGLKSTSNDPVLGSKSTSQSSNGDGEPVVPPTKSSSKTNIYTPLRERIAYSDDQKLFLELGDLDITAIDNSLMGDHHFLLPPSDLTAIFPDLQPLGLLDVAPVIPSSAAPEGKKKSEKRSDRDDPNKRIEDTTYTKLFPTGRFMYSKPTLIGPLQPSKRWKDGRWGSLDDCSAATEPENSTRISDDSVNGEYLGFLW